MGNSALKTDIIEVEEGTDTFRIIRSPDNRPATSILKRFIAEIIDSIIVLFLFFPIQLVSINVGKLLIDSLFQIEPMSMDNINLIIFFSSFYFTKSAYYYVLYRQKCTTLGKKFFHFRVYRTNTQEPIGIIRIFIREILGKSLTLIFLPISFIWYLFDGKSRFPHDLLAGTMAVEELEEHNGIDY